MMSTINIIIVEDDKDLRLMLQTFFNLQPDIKVVESFPNGNMFLETYKYLDADVVLMDISMPGKSGIECIVEAKQMKPGWQFIVSTALENHDYIFEALCAGATGYMLKSEKFEVLVDAIREVMKGGSPMSFQIARLVVSSFRKIPVKSETTDLSNREREIVVYLSQGLNYKEISGKIFISPETVRTHIRNIYGKLQVKSKLEAINKVFPK